MFFISCFIGSHFGCSPCSKALCAPQTLQSLGALMSVVYSGSKWNNFEWSNYRSICNIRDVRVLGEDLCDQFRSTNATKAEMVDSSFVSRCPEPGLWGEIPWAQLCGPTIGRGLSGLSCQEQDILCAETSKHRQLCKIIFVWHIYESTKPG